jgi:nucleoside-diphosphate-sugar epimerase
MFRFRSCAIQEFMVNLSIVPSERRQDVFIYAALMANRSHTGDGTQSRPFTHISDAMEATLKVLETPYADGEVLNIGGGPTISVVNLAYLIWRVTGMTRKPLLRFIPYSDFSRLYEDPQHRLVEGSKARYLLGHAPKISLEEGMAYRLNG